MSFVLDNSDFMGRSVARDVDIDIRYTVVTEYNKKYEIFTIVLLSIIALVLLVELLFCLVISFHSKRLAETLRIEKEEQRKLSDFDKSAVKM